MANRKYKVTDEQLKEAVNASESYAGVLRFLNIRQAGGSQSHYKRRIDNLELDISHFKKNGWKKGRKFIKQRKTPDDVLIYSNTKRRTSHNMLKRAMIEKEIKYECEKCGQDDNWFGNKLTLDVDHINEDWLDNRLENLRFLCPNCHSQYSRNLLGD